MSVFALTMIAGPNWDSSLPRREQAAWSEHAEFNDGLVDDGFVILGGPIGDGEQVLLVVEAADSSEIEDRLGKDPWLSMGVLEIGSMRPWTIWLDARAAGGAARRADQPVPVLPPGRGSGPSARQ